ncbi:hypothetical protein AUP68_08958 [Ilyonectria robusta]
MAVPEDDDQPMVVPPGYLILTSPNACEDLTFSCPHEGCDGFVFPFAERCIEHELDWHTGPYQCAECNTKFAAAPALKRHARDSKHKIEWECREAECDKFRTEFASRAMYLKHALGSAPHKHEIPVDDLPECFIVDNPPSSTTKRATKTPAKRPQPGEYICKEPCCFFYRTDYGCKSEWSRHASAVSHISALAIGQALRDRLSFGVALDAEQEAIRSLRCNSVDCPQYEHTFASTTGFFNHLKKPEHQSAVDGSADAENSKKDVGDETNLRCMQVGCPKYGRHFLSSVGFKLHNSSTPHQAASEKNGGPKPASPFTTPTGNYTTSSFSPIDLTSMPSPMSPSSPSTGRGPSVPRKTPGKTKLRLTSTSAKKREEELEKRNAELEGRVKRLEEEFEKVRHVLDKVGDMSLE